LFKRRLAREPLQYILGKTEFMSLEFDVSPAVLIPRADTETLVEWVIANFKNDGQLRGLDIGTGSGNIAISLAYYLPKVKIVGVDISKEALNIAIKNKNRYIEDNKVVFVQSDIRIESFANTFRNRFDFIVSNPPYVRCKEFKSLEPEVKKYEPRIALADEIDNGLFYQKIAQHSNYLLSENGTIFVEIGFGCVQEVKTIFQQFGLYDFKIKKDLGGIERVLLIKKQT
jgi:release factor glutamine methyltransferase